MDSEVEAENGVARRSRRAMVLGGAAAVGAALAMDGRSASAADGGGLVIGQANTGTNTTRLVVSNGSSALTVEATTGYGTGVSGIGTAYGVYGAGRDYGGVFGEASGSSAFGVVGIARDATGSGGGVFGSSRSDSASGVHGVAPGVGVFGHTASENPPSGSIGVAGSSAQPNGLGGWFAGSRAALRLVPAATTGAPSTEAHEIGDIVVGATGRVFVCTVAGTPGTWNELGAAPALRPTLQLLPVPERFIDTRDGTGGVAGTVPAGTTRTFSLTGRTGRSGDPARQVPDTAIYAVANLAVLGADGVSPGSFMTLWASGPRPEVASINFGPARTQGVVANSVLVNLADLGGGHRGFQLFTNAACDYVLDVTGYYVMA